MIETIKEDVRALYTVLKDNPKMVLYPFFVSELNLDSFLHRGPSKGKSFGISLLQLSKLTSKERESLGLEFTVEIARRSRGGGTVIWVVNRSS